VYYLGGGDEVDTSLEMGCRMGRNIARLLVGDSSQPGEERDLLDVREKVEL
jgi:hypothetical protein